MADNAKKDRANVEFMKLQRVQDGKKAMSEYEAEGVAVRAKTERLKALRLARDAAEAAAAPAAAAPKTTSATAKPRKKTKAASASLSDWMDDREKSGRNS